MTKLEKILLAVAAVVLLAGGIEYCRDIRLSHQTDAAIATADSAVGAATVVQARADSVAAASRAAGNPASDKRRRAAYAATIAATAARDSALQDSIAAARKAAADSSVIIAMQDRLIHDLNGNLIRAEAVRQAAEDTVDNLRGLLRQSATSLDLLRSSNAALTASVRPLEDDARKWRAKAERRWFVGACVQVVVVQTSPTVSAGPAVCYRVL